MYKCSSFALKLKVLVSASLICRLERLRPFVRSCTSVVLMPISLQSPVFLEDTWVQIQPHEAGS